ncbi:hypothetical protein V1509DRAFT_636059 [Lipomyces kononenkoae]
MTFTVCIARNSNVLDYNQYLFAGPNGRWQAEKLRRAIRRHTGESDKLLAPMNAQSLCQAIVDLLDQHAGHLSAIKNASLNFVDDVQSGHSSHVATTYYAIGTDDLPCTNRNDVHEFMNVSDRWIRFLGLTTSTSLVDNLTQKGTSSEQQQLTTEVL